MNTALGNYSKALDDFTTAHKAFIEINDTLHMSTTYRGFGEVYFHLGQYKEALRYFTLSLEMATIVGNKSNIADCYGSIAEVYEKQHDYKNAYLNHKLYFALSDSLLNETKSHQIAEMQTRYETERKDNEISLLNKDKAIQEGEIKKQKLLKFSFIGGLGLVIVMMLFGYRFYRAQQNLRLQSIRNKISGDLHDDIGSTLNSISIYSEVARKKDEQQDEALEMIGEASRKIIDAMSDIVWTVNPENDSFAKIIFRMKSLAYNLFRAKKIEFTFHSDESLNEKKLSLEERRNLYLIFKEAVNNLVKYSHATRASITLINEKNAIRLTIRDDGRGFDLSEDTQGNGLKNMKRRAMEMNAEFQIESGKGKCTQLELILKA
jgi:signal transduction histidine kinase